MKDLQKYEWIKKIDNLEKAKNLIDSFTNNIKEVGWAIPARLDMFKFFENVYEVIGDFLFEDVLEAVERFEFEIGKFGYIPAYELDEHMFFNKTVFPITITDFSIKTLSPGTKHYVNIEGYIQDINGHHEQQFIRDYIFWPTEGWFIFNKAYIKIKGDEKDIILAIVKKFTRKYNQKVMIGEPAIVF